MRNSPEQFKGFTLLPFQRQAAAAVDGERNVLVAAPTGAGKTLVAEYAIHRALERGCRAIYTAPVKALSNQKFRDFRGDDAIDSTGLMTGDVTIDTDARVLIMTTEILRNTLFEDPERLHDVDVVVFDEVHYMDDPERGSVWEETFLFMPQSVKVVALSATIDNLAQFASWLEQVRGRPVEVIEERKRPVPLKHLLYHPKAGVFPPNRMKPIRERFRRNRKNRSYRGRNDSGLLSGLMERELLPVLWFCFSRRLCETKAKRLSERRTFLNGAEKRKVNDIWDQARRELDFPDNRALRRLHGMVVKGIASHHAGMLPLHKELVERLFTAGLLRVLFTTETFALGINMPARAVVFDSLTKFDGVDFDYMLTREYLQMAGRAGRQGMDEVGFVYSSLSFDDIFDAPIHRLIDGAVEPIRSRFSLDYATLVHLHGVAGDAAAIDAWERSFAAFQGREQSRKKRDKARARMRRRLERRFAFLVAMGYIGGEREILPRGRTSLGLYGYEVVLTELLFEGILHRADPPSLAAVVAAVIHEGRRGERFWRGGLRPFLPLIRAGDRAVSSAIDSEVSVGLEPTIKPLDVGMSPAMYAWAEGATFEELERYTSAAAGDFVRVARMTVQYLRHLRKAVKDDPDRLGDRLTEAITLVQRGPVDARKELGVSMTEPTEDPNPSSRL